LVNHLSDELSTPDPNPNRQTILDDHVRSRIHAEMARLREEEAGVRAEIEHALERENIDRERTSAVPEQDSDSVATDGAVRTSLSLREDVRQVQQKIERLQKLKEMDDVLEVKATSEMLVECYRYVPLTLDLRDIYSIPGLKKEPSNAIKLLERGIRFQGIGRAGRTS